MAVCDVRWRAATSLASIAIVDRVYWNAYIHGCTWYAPHHYSPFLVLITTRHNSVPYHPPKPRNEQPPPLCDFSSHICHQPCRSHFYCTEGDIFSKACTRSWFGSQQSIYAGRGYMRWIGSSHSFMQYVVRCSALQSVFCVVYIDAKFRPYKCTCPQVATELH